MVSSTPEFVEKRKRLPRLTNVQIDGLGASGSATVYMDKLTIYRW